MHLITCIGYSCTGSSAVNNILRELDCVSDLTPHNECRFLQDPDGIRDLEYNLFDCRHRLNSDYAIKRYMKYVFKYDKRNFKQIFGKDWIIYNKEFVSKLYKFDYSGYWHADLRNLNISQKLKYFSFRGYKIICSKIFRTKRESTKNIFPKFKMYLPINDKTIFYDSVKMLCDNLFKSLNINMTPFGIVDQLIPPSNIEKYLNYVTNLKVIVVDRDPRDIYLENIPKKDRAFPKEINKFCDLYIDHRRNCDFENENILRIKFEDIIYDFDNTYSKIIEFVGINNDDYNFKFKYFNINKSAKNTRLWNNITGYETEIKYIEQNLSNYLYDYSKLDKKNNIGKCDENE